MNWVCESCGYENEYNDESQPTECQCCLSPASEKQLIHARRELEKYHKELERQRKLEQLRVEAIRRQEKIERSVKVFINSMKGIAAACIVLMCLAIAIIGFNVYKGNVSLKQVNDNIKRVTVMDDITVSSKTISEYLSTKSLAFKDSFVQNVTYAAKNGEYPSMDNREMLVEDKKDFFSVLLQRLRNLEPIAK